MTFFMGLAKDTNRYEICTRKWWNPKSGFHGGGYAIIYSDWAEKLLGKPLKPGQMIEVDIQIKPIRPKKTTKRGRHD